MKDIITDCSMTEIRHIAQDKWKEYTAAARTYKDPIYKDLQKVYNQVKNGQKVIDISKVIAKGGIHPDIKPKLAISSLKYKKIFCTYHKDGRVQFKPDNSGWGRRISSFDVNLPGCLPLWIPQDKWTSRQMMEAPVPPVPPRFMPKKLTDDYYILWEVDEWKMVPPVDPYLLKRITKTMFVVLAGWDLTDLERSAMAGRMI